MKWNPKQMKLSQNKWNHPKLRKATHFAQIPPPPVNPVHEFIMIKPIAMFLGDNSIVLEKEGGLDADGNRLEVVMSQKKPPLVCGDIQQFKIFPQDSPQVVRKKQGILK